MLSEYKDTKKHKTKERTIADDIAFEIHLQLGDFVRAVYDVYRLYFSSYSGYGDFFKAYWPMAYTTYLSGISVEQYVKNLLEETLSRMDSERASGASPDFLALNLFMIYLLTKYSKETTDVLQILRETYAKLIDKEKADEYENFINDLYILVIEKPEVLVDALYCFRDCVRCIYYSLRGVIVESR